MTPTMASSLRDPLLDLDDPGDARLLRWLLRARELEEIEAGAYRGANEEYEEVHPARSSCSSRRRRCPQGAHDPVVGEHAGGSWRASSGAVVGWPLAAGVEIRCWLQQRRRRTRSRWQ
jgi:hypothetical protein